MVLEKQKGTGKHLFQKGQSGNPNGRPRKDKTLLTILEAELKNRPSINGKKSEHTWEELLVQAWLRGSLQKPVLLQMLLERVYGKVREELDITTKGEAIGNGHIDIPEQHFADALVILAKSGVSQN